MVPRVHSAAVTPGADDVSWASGVGAGLYAAGSRHVVCVPDTPLSRVIEALGREYPDVATTTATREEEAFGIAAGLYLGGIRPTVMLQSSGFGNSLNAITSLLVACEIPALVLVSLRGDADEWNAAQVPMGRAVAPICEALGLPWARVASGGSAAATVETLGRMAFAIRRPTVCLLPRRLTLPASAPGRRP